MRVGARFLLVTAALLTALLQCPRGFAQVAASPSPLSPTALDEARSTDGASRFADEIQPLLKRACLSCHGPMEQEASFRVDKLNPNLIEGPDSAWWIEVMNVIANSEMPPADASVSLADSERAKLIDWISNELQVASKHARASQEASSFRRMTNYEYSYALQDLLGLPYDFARDLPPETTSQDGFLNSSEMLHLTMEQLNIYRETASVALAKATVQSEKPHQVFYSITMDKGADLMLQGHQKQIQKIRARNLTAEKEKEQIEKLESKARSFNPNSAHFMNQETGAGVQGKYSYGGARYSWSPVDSLPNPPSKSADVLMLPTGSRQIIDLGDSLPQTGTLRIRLRASRTSAESIAGDPDLRIEFGFQASNNSQTSFRVGPDITIRSTPSNREFYEFRIHLGEIPRNPYRGSMTLGQTPNPSEYLVLTNWSLSREHGGILIDYIEITAPFFESWPPDSHRKIFSEDTGSGKEPEQIRSILSRFMYRAWRREVSKEELDQKVNLYESIRPHCSNDQQAICEVLATVLSSPKFLFLSTSEPGSGQLSDSDLATRLSMFLWCSIPDEELLRVATQSDLADPVVLAGQVERMLNDPRSNRFVEQFCRQWLGMQLLDYLKVDRKKHRHFNNELKASMQREPIEFINHMLRENASVLDILHSDYLILNQRLASLYQVPNVRGSHFRKVALNPESQRGGLLTQAGLLAMNSDGSDSHPLKRGIWLLENILDDPPPPPPPAVPEIDLSDPEILKLSLKERMEDHRNDPACSSCHMRIDPWGIAFENFDATGKWRDEISGRPVDSVSTLFNRQKLSGIEGLKQFLLENRQDQFTRALTRKLCSYALGRPLGFSDHDQIEKIVTNLRSEGDGLRDLIHFVVTSHLFRSR